jgi:hypothetical protein
LATEINELGDRGKQGGDWLKKYKTELNNYEEYDKSNDLSNCLKA